jgi:hypothetical protein
MTKAYQEAERVGRPAGGAGPAHLLTVEHRCCGGVLLRGGVAPEEHGPTPPPSARPTATTMVGGANWIGLSLSRSYASKVDQILILGPSRGRTSLSRMGMLAT